MHKCVGVHDAIIAMTKLKSTSEQHVDLVFQSARGIIKILKNPRAV